MRKSKALLVAIAACVTLVLAGGVAYAAGAFRTGTSAATAAPVPAYGACVNQKSGVVRMLERANPSKSRYGACKQDGSEKFVLLGGDVTKVETKVEKLPETVVYSVGGEDYLCKTARSVRVWQVKDGKTVGKSGKPARYACGEASRVKLPKVETPATP